jgi:hypothetical protein
MDAMALGPWWYLCSKSVPDNYDEAYGFMLLRYVALANGNKYFQELCL